MIPIRAIMANYLGRQILFGDVLEDELPKLPDGFRYDVKPECWVLAIAPDGQVYYVARDKLYPRRQRPETQLFFVDTQNGVIQLDDETKQTS